MIRRDLLLLPLLLGVSGCYRTFLPPPPPADPVEVWFVHEAWHKGVVLPGPDGGREEWGMGEWAWYAEGAQGVADMPRAVLWPTLSGLSRRSIQYGSPAAMAAAQEKTRVLAFAAERERVEALRERLEGAWAAGVALADRDPEIDLARGSRGERFVPLDEGYWMFWNCNDAAAEWLRFLGCPVNSAFQSWSLSLRAAPTYTEVPRPVRIYLAPPPGGPIIR